MAPTTKEKITHVVMGILVVLFIIIVNGIANTIGG